VLFDEAAERVACVGSADVHADERGEAVRVALRAVQRIAGVIAVNSGGVHQNGPVDPGRAHVFQQVLGGPVRPRGQRPAARGDRISLAVSCNHVHVGVDDVGHVVLKLCDVGTESLSV
jgi:hypothetical protein